jgi:predicted MFS family arabinose efflux permease
MEEPDRFVHCADTPGVAVVVAVCASEILGLTSYALVPALLPQFIQDWSLTSTEAGWLVGVLFAGYMLGVLPLVGATDRLPARSIYLASSSLNALSCLGIALSNSLLPALWFRGLAGVALAGMYMPGLRSLTERTEGPKRARITGFYTSSFTVGASLSFLLGRAATEWGWRGAFIIAGILGATGTLVAWLALPPHQPATVAPRGAAFPYRRVFADRDVVVLVCGYAAVIWGSVGLRQWIVGFLDYCGAAPAIGSTPDWSMLVTGAVIGLLGVPAGLLGNELSIRFGLRNTALFMFLAAAAANGAFGLTALLPYSAAVVVSLAAGFIVQGNFSNLTAGLLVVAARQHTGATIAVYSCIGFAGGFVGNVMFGIALDLFGRTPQITAWVVSFATCAVAGLIGAGATALLSRHAELRESP